ncbi:class I SAM-dependent methyltransferase [Sporolactobacillus shoreicorticis]|uniref:Class I SAM-dependent methyltransferase n=1 Tax=Sporolactobacillus shoreicorticis TaxID=1923877 RepID=A0ABW5S2B3_9BACL|nr:class I SAM-dependent methyltransferase [Sporolactobacillus shoreicorticis]MCO7126484.1 class I SAM-dependent methyltransferase [Sporolactobacillus shoreicorticis]
MSERLEDMSSFFDKRVDNYEQHMRDDVTDSLQFYAETASLIPAKKNLKLLDLGCGTGLELDEIFKINENVFVTGIDLSSKMLERLMLKHKEKSNHLNLIKGSYFDVDFGTEKFDIALSVQTMHHFTHEEKVTLYAKLHDCLLADGYYVETDYIANAQKDEDFYYAESKRLKAKQGITKGFYHFDTPCTVGNQMNLLRLAGFSCVKLHKRYRSAAIFVAEK